MTYQMQAQLDKDGVPNMGEVQNEQPGAPRLHSPHPGSGPQWHIPAVHTGGVTPGSSRARRAAAAGPGLSATTQGGGKRGLADKAKPGAAFKLGRRQAYLKYLAYEVGACGGGCAVGGCWGMLCSWWGAWELENLARAFCSWAGGGA